MSVAGPEPPMSSESDYRVIVAAPHWTLNGVNVFSLNLVRGLRRRGVDARVVLTEEDTELVSTPDPPMARPSEVPFDRLPVEWWEGWGAHWGAMIRYLEAQAPCVYIPNYDYRHSCVSPLLPPTVSIVGVVHSDDPLHYEHVTRLGEYWDATVCVSRTLAERTVELCPAISERVRAIPIGISMPAEQPAREPEPGGVLRLVYHGMLKQHQKRVLDLPRVVAALEERGVPVELSIAGGGPDEERLREACAGQVERGTVRFLGVVSHDRIPELLRASDVFLLTSEFEGMPNALLEAMANGCVPVVSDMESGIPEVVRDGESGFLPPVGDVEAFADRLERLQADPELRRRMAASAYASVSRGAFSSEQMIDAYVEVFDAVVEAARRGDFERPAGELVPPPAEVEGVGIFQARDDSWVWELGHREEGVGSFPSWQDYHDFERRLSPRSRPSASDLRVIAGSPFWTDNWSNVKCHELLRGLARAGVPARLLLTEERTRLVEIEEPRLPYPTEVPVDHLPVGRKEGWGGHWGATIRYLERQAPCIYLPLHDWRHACVAPRLSSGVIVVGTLTGDELHLEQVARLADSLNAVVASGAGPARDFARGHPQLADRTTVIRPGLDVLEEAPSGRGEEGALPRILVYEPEGRGHRRLPGLEQTLAALEAVAGPVSVTIVGSHPEHSGTLALLRRGSRSDDREVVGPASHAELLELFESHDVAVAWPDGETLGEDLLRAMGRGCVPVILSEASIRLLDDEINGVRVSPDDPGALAERLGELSDPARRAALSVAAHRTASKLFGIDDMAAAYLQLFDRLRRESEGGSFQRLAGELRPPPKEVAGVSIFPVELPYAVDGVGRFPSASDYRRFRGQQGPWQRLRDLLAR